MSVYVLAGEGVSANIIIGVYSTSELATEAAEKVWPTTDGYHDFVITEYEIDPGIASMSYSGGSRTPKPLEVEYR